MTFKAGQSGNPNGRPKGSKNKQMLAVIDWLEALGCDPIEGMARITMDERADLSLRAQVYKELLQYIAPKHEAVEMKAVRPKLIPIKSRIGCFLERRLTGLRFRDHGSYVTPRRLRGA